MSDAAKPSAVNEPLRRLADAIREVKNAAAERDDVVVELRDAQRMRLELLAAELEPVFADVPSDDDQFDFALSSGLQPRLWIDATSHVTMGRDKRTYRFLKDTRLGRVVLSESHDLKPVAHQVTRYIAERILERRKMMDGDVLPLRHSPAEGGSKIEFRWSANGAPWGAVLSGIGLFFAGSLAGAAIAIAWFWDKLAPILGG
jgi:hypothetical protein